MYNVLMGQVVKLGHQNVLAAIQAHYPNYHPVLAMVHLAHHENVKGKDPKLEFEIHKAVAPYCAPRLASLEITPPRDDRRVIVSLFEDVVQPNGVTTQVEVPLIREIEEVVPLDAD